MTHINTLKLRTVDLQHAEFAMPSYYMNAKTATASHKS